MVNLDILGGLKSALERGDSLERAMLTLFNAKYKKEEIEEAARSLVDLKLDKQIQPLMRNLPKSAEIPTAQLKTKSAQELRAALEREHSLKKAMIILFNSGYKLEEIIKAARDLLEFGSISQIPTTSTIIRIPTPMQKQEQKPEQKQALQPQQVLQAPTIIRVPTPMQQQEQKQALQMQQPAQSQKAIIQIQKPIQKVSSYEKPKVIKEKSKGKMIIIILSCLLGFLVLLEGVIFVFKKQFIDFLNSFLG